ncbi:MAG: hypothetical protein COA84_13450 [Robiginitomaculum sp.]|nr:MAG: hypothetical protein COA84_13450 [Robiginitomaculum sp.]
MDLFLVFSFIKRLVLPFIEWEAFKLGIIDKDGKILKSRKQLRTQKERAAFGTFDLMILKLKTLLGKFPGGRTRIANYAAALWLIKEQKIIEDHGEELTEDYIIEGVKGYLNILNENTDLKFEIMLHEEGSATSVGGGQFAGLEPDDPPVNKRVMKKFKKKNKTTQKEI